MATKTWRGVAPASRGYYESIGSGWGTENAYFTLQGRVGPKLRITAATTATVLYANLAALYAAAGPEWAQFSWVANGGTNIQVTGPADGRTPSLLLTFDGSGTPTNATPVQGTGPNFWDNTANWIGGVVPVATNDLVYSGGAPPYYNFPGTGTTFGSLTWNPESRGGGLPDTNPAGFEEYMPTLALSLKHTGAVLVLTSAYLRLDSQPAAARTFTVASPAATTGGLQLTTDANAHILIHTSGRVLVADAVGEAAQLTSAAVAADPATGPVASLVLGAGVALTTLTQSGGAVALKCGYATLTHTAGDLTVTGATAGTTHTQTGGREFDSGTGTVGTRNSGGYCKYVGSGTGRTITTLVPKPNGRYLDWGGKVAVTNGYVVTGFVTAGPPGETGDSPFYHGIGGGKTVTLT